MQIRGLQHKRSLKLPKYRSAEAKVPLHTRGPSSLVKQTITPHDHTPPEGLGSPSNAYIVSNQESGTLRRLFTLHPVSGDSHASHVQSCSTLPSLKHRRSSPEPFRPLWEMWTMGGCFDDPPHPAFSKFWPPMGLRKPLMSATWDFK